MGGKERRGITHSHFPEWKKRKATHQLNSCLHIELAQLSFASINQMVQTWDVFLSPVKTASSFFLTYEDCVSTPGVLHCKL